MIVNSERLMPEGVGAENRMFWGWNERKQGYMACAPDESSKERGARPLNFTVKVSIMCLRRWGGG